MTIEKSKDSELPVQTIIKPINDFSVDTSDLIEFCNKSVGTEDELKFSEKSVSTHDFKQFCERGTQTDEFSYLNKPISVHSVQCNLPPVKKSSGKPKPKRQSSAVTLKQSLENSELEIFTKKKLCKAKITRPRQYERSDMVRGLMLSSMSKRALEFCKKAKILYIQDCKYIYFPFCTSQNQPFDY